jgi:ribosome-associated toxin RatA of RatAB toxin-antitoxin module
VKDLSASANGRTSAPIEQSFALLSDIESYPDWYPEGVRAAEVLERDSESGQPTRVKTTLYTSSGPVQREFRLHMGLTLRPPELVELRRLPHEDRDREEMTVTWRLASGPQTLITLDLHARLDVPGFLPVGGLAQGMADRFLGAALKRLGR